MRKLMFTVMALMVVFTMLRAYADIRGETISPVKSELAGQRAGD